MEAVVSSSRDWVADRMLKRWRLHKASGRSRLFFYLVCQLATAEWRQMLLRSALSVYSEKD